MTVRLKSSALLEWQVAARWYEGRAPGTGERLIQAVEAALKQVGRVPEAAPVWKLGLPYRRQTVRGFPFVVFFRVAGEDQVVLAIAHTRRKPGYWLKRSR